MNIIKAITQEQINKVIELSLSGNRSQLEKYINDMSPQVKAELAVLIWKGRGEEIADSQHEIDFALNECKDKNFVSYLVNKPLHKYLCETRV